MLIPFIIGSLAVFLTYLTRYRQNGLGLKMAFFVIFVFLALRYDYGNDYMNYLEGFGEIWGWDLGQITLSGMQWEPGWIFLNSLFKPFGFFVMIAFTSLLTCIVFYRFIRNYVPAQYQWLAVFLYVFDPALILVPSTTMRQNMGILLFLIGIEFLYKKKKQIIIYLTLAIVAATFHRSAYVLPLFVVLAFINIKINKVVAIVFILLFVSMFLFGHVVFGFVNTLVSAYVPKYAGYMLGSGSRLNTGIGFVYIMFQLISVLYFAGMEFAPHAEESLDFQEQQEIDFLPSEQEYDLLPVDPHAAFLNLKARRLLFKIAIITFIFIPFGRQVALISRVGMYFEPVLIAVYPIILFTTKDRLFHMMFLFSLMSFTLFKFWMFFLSPVWVEKFGTYQTIFSAPQIY